MTKHQQLVTALEQQIRDGSLAAGQKLPSIRKMSIAYGCSPATVVRAYEQLARDQWVYVMNRSGYYVARQQLDIQHDQSTQRIDLASAAPAAEIFPFEDFQSSLQGAMHIYRDQLFTYGMPQGLPPLLEEIRQQLEEVQVFARSSQLHITSGVHRALSILTMMPFPSGRETILIEQPGYHLLIEMLETLKVPVQEVERTSEGLDLERVEELFQQGAIKFFYVMPRFHNPLGTSLTKRQKKKLVALAHRYDVYLVEDDYLSDLEPQSSNDPLYAYDMSGHVIYLKSYSKILFPGLRIGAAVLPDALIDTFARYKSMLDVDSSVLSQAALHVYIQNGMFAHYRRLVLEAYRERIQQLRHSLKELAADHPVFAGAKRTDTIHTILPLPVNFPTGTLIRRLAEQQITVDSTDRYFLSGSSYRSNQLRINVSNVPASQIDPALRTVAHEIGRLLISPRH
ncbi:PLP-dependent aminotransferase family protein [Paenibacillus bovis]|uniref:HTH gntR-type domain-containing protein n=1 Tax=Paenibacillus bovis TaxID=1616788 RepID=A0A172ZEE7_9BACL|nr:PLP-dependent aminotransferase family protein [Paenibacillus bovis]ANF95530.1 hypothetical protein AR543_05585 [Paenibacillus bovis]